MRAPFSRPDGVSNSGEISVIWSTPNSLAKNTAIRIVAGDSLRRSGSGSAFPCRHASGFARQRELADGRRRLKIERREVDRLVRAVLDHLDDARQRLALRQIAGPRLVHVGAEGVVQLQRVDAQMDVRRAKARRVDEAGKAPRRRASSAALRPHRSEMSNSVCSGSTVRRL